MSKIEAIIFDFDGVIIDSEQLYNVANHRVLTRVGIHIEPDELHQKFIGMHYQQMLNILIEEYGIDKTRAYAEQIQDEIYALMETDLQTIEHVIDMIEGLDRPYHVGSNAEKAWIERKIQMLNIEHIFDGKIVGADCVPNPKPAPDMFLKAAQNMNVKPENIAVVEDGIYGIHAARQLGMTPLGFIGQRFRMPNHQQKLEQAGAALIFDDMRRLPEILANIKS